MHSPGRRLSSIIAAARGHGRSAASSTLRFFSEAQEFGMTIPRRGSKMVLIAHVLRETKAHPVLIQSSAGSVDGIELRVIAPNPMA
jgi:hypothetical protein